MSSVAVVIGALRVNSQIHPDPTNCKVVILNMLTLKALIMTAADTFINIFSLFFFFFFFEENKTGCFKWIFCQAEDSREISSLIFFKR